jgi:hypothetical protein
MNSVRDRLPWLLGALLLACPGPQAAEFEVNPWAGDNAVVPLGSVDFGGSARHPWMTGSIAKSLAAERGRNLFMTISVQPKRRVELVTGSRRGSADSPLLWQVDRGHDLVPDPLPPGAPFEVAFFQNKGRRTEPESVLSITNLVAGPVWAVVVNPEADSHHMNPVSAAGNRRVRVLPLENSGGAWISPGWLQPNAAESNRLYCGMPRALTELLGRNAPTSMVFGLVLVSSSHLSGPSKSEFELSGWRPAQRNEADPYLATIVTNANEANFAARFGGERRHDLLRQDFEHRLADEKREGKVGERFRLPQLKWTKFAPGDCENLPLRVHGLIR